ncbi:2-dehydropantoate 2-reductase [Chryseobacterium sp. RRHN12]|uniref:2-dehydropantoate 2-reductase n=1 Tax=Chryseobacterium sp. RRHN12 TaxID=3437884 RepID=UPI003D9B0183
MKTRKRKIAVVGAGAIGSYYGILLSEMGFEVHFLFHSTYEKMKKHGLLLKSAYHGDITLSNPWVYYSAEDMPVCEIILVGLKTTHNQHVLPKVLPYIADRDTAVIMIQNGLDMEKGAAALLPDLQFAGAVTPVRCYKDSKGNIVHEGNAAIDLGNFNLRNPERLRKFAKAFTAFGIPSSYQDLTTIRWKKLVWNMAFNGLSVVLDATTDQILNKAEKRCRTIMNEVADAARSQGVAISTSFIDELILLTKTISPYAPSMKRDFENFRPMELEYIYEKPIATARKAGIEMPETTRLFHELQSLEETGSPAK